MPATRYRHAKRRSDACTLYMCSLYMNSPTQAATTSQASQGWFPLLVKISFPSFEPTNRASSPAKILTPSHTQLHVTHNNTSRQLPAKERISRDHVLVPPASPPAPPPSVDSTLAGTALAGCNIPPTFHGHGANHLIINWQHHGRCSKIDAVLAVFFGVTPPVHKIAPAGSENMALPRSITVVCVGLSGAFNTTVPRIPSSGTCNYQGMLYRPHIPNSGCGLNLP